MFPRTMLVSVTDAVRDRHGFSQNKKIQYFHRGGGCRLYDQIDVNKPWRAILKK